MSEKRRDNKGRILRTGESQRTDGRYMYKYVNRAGETKGCVFMETGGYGQSTERKA